MLKNVKQIIDISKERNCWKDIGITYHNVCEIAKQLQAKQTQDKGLEDIIDDPVLEEPDPELDESIEIIK